MRDKVEVNNRYYAIETTTDIEGMVCIKIYLEKSGEKKLLVEQFEKNIQAGDKSMVLRMWHQRILAVFFKIMQNSGHVNEKEIIEILKKELAVYSDMGKKETEKKSGQMLEKYRTTAESWNTFCRKYMPSNAYAAFMQRNGVLREYYSEGYDATQDKEVSLSLKKFFIQHRQKITYMIGGLHILTYSTTEKHYFIFTSHSEAMVAVVMSSGKLGLYMKEIEVFKKHVSLYFR